MRTSCSSSCCLQPLVSAPTFCWRVICTLLSVSLCVTRICVTHTALLSTSPLVGHTHKPLHVLFCTHVLVCCQSQLAVSGALPFLCLCAWRHCMCLWPCVRLVILCCCVCLCRLVLCCSSRLVPFRRHVCVSTMYQQEAICRLVCVLRCGCLGAFDTVSLSLWMFMLVECLHASSRWAHCVRCDVL